MRIQRGKRLKLHSSQRKKRSKLSAQKPKIKLSKTNANLKIKSKQIKSSEKSTEGLERTFLNR